MHTLSQQLPPLDALVAFEAAARHASFTLAARELNITQAAVSQRIRGLENSLGVALFVRAHRAVSLTPAGKEYQHSVALALSHLASATTGLNPPAGNSRLTIAADEAVAALWLTPRIAEFTAVHPEISLRIIVSDALADCLAEPVDVAIVFGGEDAPGFSCVKFFDEEVFPVCSPAYLAANPKISSAQGLAAAQLVELEDNRWDWMNWRIWLTEVLGTGPENLRRIQINSYPLIVEAAKNGMGVALGWRYLVDEAIAGGTLVRPLQASLKTRFGYNLLIRTGGRAGAGVTAFSDWLIATTK